ncbi:hypothetical protein, partial [Microbacterium sp.]|uniref:hypothetical protein n=1 Tax=Microbacterium sp. TaxID=51671 RepID=UPI00289AF6DA
MSLLRTVVLPALGAIAVLTAVGRTIRLFDGDDPHEDRAVRAMQTAFGHVPAGADAGSVDASDATGKREPVDRVTAPLSWYSGVPQTIANGALWCGVTWVL